MSLYRIILEPITTEKTSVLDVKNNVVTVKVAPEATKIDIKKAFKLVYDIDVVDVRVTTMREKYKYGRK
jgi:large subunit ribosomal protein L23